MKILHFITSLRTGGAERLVCDLTPRLRDMGNEVEVLLMDGTRTPMFSELFLQPLQGFSTIQNS